MNWIDKLERRYGRFGIPHLVNGLLVGQLVAGLIVLLLAVAAAGLAALLAGRKISCDVVAGFNADLRTDVFSLVNNMTFE